MIDAAESVGLEYAGAASGCLNSLLLFQIGKLENVANILFYRGNLNVT